MNRRTPESILANLSGPNGFNADERETSILIDHYDGVVYLETSEPYTARRWYRLFADVEEATFETHRDTFGVKLPAKCCRQPELVILPKYRKSLSEGLYTRAETPITPQPVPEPVRAGKTQHSPTNPMH